MSLISTAHDKLCYAVSFINFHNMPQYGLSANLYHGLGLTAGFYLNALLAFHKEEGRILTISTTRPEGRFGALKLNENKNTVEGFKEKAREDQSWVNIVEIFLRGRFQGIPVHLCPCIKQHLAQPGTFKPCIASDQYFLSFIKSIAHHDVVS